MIILQIETRSIGILFSRTNRTINRTLNQTPIADPFDYSSLSLHHRYYLRPLAVLSLALLSIVFANSFVVTAGGSLEFRNGLTGIRLELLRDAYEPLRAAHSDMPVVFACVSATVLGIAAVIGCLVPGLYILGGIAIVLTLLLVISSFVKDDEAAEAEAVAAAKSE